MTTTLFIMIIMLKVMMIMKPYHVSGSGDSQTMFSTPNNNINNNNNNNNSNETVLLAMITMDSFYNPTLPVGEKSKKRF